MIKVIKGGEVYSPESMGKKDVVLVGDKIGAVGENLSMDNSVIETEVIDATGKLVVPGFIDGHVHITGGGGEGSFKTRTPEIMLTDITRGGVTTIVGCLGTDGITRSMENLLAKARGLDEEGVTTYIYTGSYRVPTTTITGSVMKDIVLFDKVIGTGEIAISDHRSSQANFEMLKQLVADTRVGGILSGKAGVVNFHLGDGNHMLNHLFEICEKTEIPITQFWPTHVNRNPELFNEGKRYAKQGGFIDFTTSSDPVFWEEGETKASKALKICLDEGVPEDRITFTSDGQGSLPQFNSKGEFVRLGIGKVTSLFAEVRDAVLEDNVPIERALRVITANPAKILKLENKGWIRKGGDADVVILNKETLEIETVIARGKTMILNGEIKVFGTFEC